VPVLCGLLQNCVKSSQLVTLEDVSLGQKLVKKCLLLDDKERDDKGNNKEEDKHEQNERKKEKGEEVAFSIIAINHNNNSSSSCFSELEPIFVREVGLLTRLDHPNVLQICGVVREAKYLGFVTQWMSSGTLWSWLQQQKQKKKPPSLSLAQQQSCHHKIKLNQRSRTTLFDNDKKKQKKQSYWTCGTSPSSCVTPSTTCTAMAWCTTT